MRASLLFWILGLILLFSRGSHMLYACSEYRVVEGLQSLSAPDRGGAGSELTEVLAARRAHWASEAENAAVDLALAAAMGAAFLWDRRQRCALAQGNTASGALPASGSETP